MQRRTQEGSAIEPMCVVKGDSSRSSPTTAYCISRNVRTRASPRCPELPVTNTFIVLFRSIHDKSQTFASIAWLDDRGRAKPLFIVEVLGVEFGALPGCPSS